MSRARLVRTAALAICVGPLLAAAHGDVALAAGWAVRKAAPLVREGGRFHDLTGPWLGEYRYPERARAAPVPFNALIEDRDGALSGSIDEPNTFAPEPVPRLHATLTGARVGRDVSFVKTMDGSGGVSHSIEYDGVVDPGFTRIDGRWYIGRFSGRFFMERAAALAAVGRAVIRRAEAKP